MIWELGTTEWGSRVLQEKELDSNYGEFRAQILFIIFGWVILTSPVGWVERLFIQGLYGFAARVVKYMGWRVESKLKIDDPYKIFLSLIYFHYYKFFWDFRSWILPGVDDYTTFVRLNNYIHVYNYVNLYMTIIIS